MATTRFLTLMILCSALAMSLAACQSSGGGSAPASRPAQSGGY